MKWPFDFLFFQGNLQPLLDKNSEDLEILILEFDNVTVKNHLLFALFSQVVQLGVQFGGTRFVPSLLEDLLKSPFNSTHKPSLNYRKHN